MRCRLHDDNEIDHKDLLEHILEHQLTIEEKLMGDLSKLTTAVEALVAQHSADQAEIASLKAAGDDDQAAIDGLTAEAEAALPTPAPIAPVDTIEGAPASDTPLADETQAELNQPA